MLLLDGEGKVVAHSQIQGEVRFDSPVVLHKSANRVEPQIAVRIANQQVAATE